MRNFLYLAILIGFFLVSYGGFLKIQKSDNATLFLAAGLVVEMIAVVALLRMKKKKVSA